MKALPSSIGGCNGFSSSTCSDFISQVNKPCLICLTCPGLIYVLMHTEKGYQIKGARKVKKYAHGVMLGLL